MASEKKIYYMSIAVNNMIVADYGKMNKAKYQQSTSDVLSKLGRGDIIIPFNEMEYAVKNETVDNGNTSITYLMLIEKGYYQVRAFNCLEKAKEEFNKFFDRSQISNARFLSLNKQFEGQFERVYVVNSYSGRIRQEYARQDGSGTRKSREFKQESDSDYGQPDSKR